eukprot:CAMPEP_0182583680 /NCGR_PEP_ID=MMETSP1324-20130603/55781_1 /TAXON_ID=236786 /ORGANISM="Florenciella sp., Strain RCC1587" /LENGTH=91 /DNA_ID=CAMNT_0024800261 /DNA_START=216 /DNA_END=487 /DNA_ORIENTATION=-
MTILVCSVSTSEYLFATFHVLPSSNLTVMLYTVNLKPWSSSRSVKSRTWIDSNHGTCTAGAWNRGPGSTSPAPASIPLPPPLPPPPPPPPP